MASLSRWCSTDYGNWTQHKRSHGTRWRSISPRSTRFRGSLWLTKKLPRDAYGLNIWTKTPSPRAVAALAREPGTKSGDALAWSMLRVGIMGIVEISYNYEVQLMGKRARLELLNVIYCNKQLKSTIINRLNSLLRENTFQQKGCLGKRQSLFHFHYLRK